MSIGEKRTLNAYYKRRFYRGAHGLWPALRTLLR